MLKQNIMSLLRRIQNEYPDAIKDEKTLRALANDVLQNDSQYKGVLRYLCIALFEHDALELLQNDIQRGENFATTNLLSKLTGEGAQHSLAVEVTGYLLVLAGRDDKAVAGFVSSSRHLATSGSVPMTPIMFAKRDWLVLEEQGEFSLLLNAKVLEKRAYNITDEEVTWEICSLRDYLNNEFLDSFNPEERSKITHWENINDDNPWFDAKGGSNTTDMVFLLSLDEVVKYFGDSGQLRDNPPSIKMWLNDPGYNKSRIAFDEKNTAVVWWLRSPGDTNRSAAAVMGNGFITPSGFAVSNDEGGVRPAMWVNMTKGA